MNTRVNRISKNRYGYYVEGLYGKRTIYHNTYNDLLVIANKVRCAMHSLFTRKNTAEPINYKTYFKYTKFFAVLGYSNQLNRVSWDNVYKYIKPSKYNPTEIKKRDYNRYGQPNLGYSFASILNLRHKISYSYNSNKHLEVHLENISHNYDSLIPKLDSLSLYKETLTTFNRGAILAPLRGIIINTVQYLIHKVDDYHNNVSICHTDYAIDPSIFYGDVVIERLFRVFELYTIIIDLINLKVTSVKEDKERLVKLKDIILQLDIHLLDIFMFVNLTTNSEEKILEIKNTDVYKIYKLDALPPIPSLDGLKLSTHLEHCLRHRLEDTIYLDTGIPSFIEDILKNLT